MTYGIPAMRDGRNNRANFKKGDCYYTLRYWPIGQSVGQRVALYTVLVLVHGSTHSKIT